MTTFKYSVDSFAVDPTAATNTLVSSNVQVTAGDKVLVNGKPYTFTATPAVEGDVLFETNADTSLQHLADATNHAGTPGIDYVCALANPDASSSNPAAHTLTFTARVAGVAGNALTLSKVAATFSVGGATFSGGVDGMPGSRTEVRRTVF